LLLVQNTKATNERANGVFRHLDLSSMSDAQFEPIYDMVSIAEGHASEPEETFHDLQKRILDYMYHAVRSAFVKRRRYPTLYSYRHQFAAARSTSGIAGTSSDVPAGPQPACRLMSVPGNEVSPTERNCCRCWPSSYSTQLPGPARARHGVTANAGTNHRFAFAGARPACMALTQCGPTGERRHSRREFCRRQRLHRGLGPLGCRQAACRADLRPCNCTHRPVACAGAPGRVPGRSVAGDGIEALRFRPGVSAGQECLQLR
jgi:hypothetical protein